MRRQRALQRRRHWLQLASLLFAVLACGAGWLLWHFWQTAWSLPLSAPLSDIHFPQQVFNEDGRPQRSYNKAAVGLSFVALLSVGITIFVRSWAEDGIREMVGLVGGVCTAMILLVAWSMQADAQVNGRLRKLADQGSFAELERLTRNKPGLPYAKYIGAQALVLAGKGDELQRDYGAWLQDWGRKAGAKADWEGSSASPRVMRLLEQRAFGRGTSVFSTDYEARVRRETEKAWREGPLVGGAFFVFAVLAAITALWARVLGRRIEA